MHLRRCVRDPSRWTHTFRLLWQPRLTKSGVSPVPSIPEVAPARPHPPSSQHCVPAHLSRTQREDWGARHSDGPLRWAPLRGAQIGSSLWPQTASPPYAAPEIKAPESNSPPDAGHQAQVLSAPRQTGQSHPPGGHSYCCTPTPRSHCPKLRLRPHCTLSPHPPPPAPRPHRLTLRLYESDNSRGLRYMEAHSICLFVTFFYH